ncbi:MULTISPECIES: CopG family transcriptional regulator [unclassified Fusibacter]|uniref:CopG family transcriptional regulator n=1 Tax=unclassified Fusibacter TaxID=2624464 RepID=UPI0010132F26|nr:MULTISPECIES: CopG family transcriptional regulator [unclassified Fusibacter]MCK8060546.1 CopG family transcriptional regulator [Fusibacter sp. A2]NPE23000.1 CopG family transcriptional regulator [Fusibacter sp. A1]RXV60065.1 CopG family transcriptional regulator [Fusibacter sp. A1]
MQGTNPVFEYLSEDMKREYKHYVKCHSDHGAIINEAMKLYIGELKRNQRIQELRSGYEQMAEINLDYAETGFVGDMTSLDDYEHNLKMRKK